MEPHGGPISGGTEVTVYGTNFAGGDQYKCKFGTELVSATYQSDRNVILCSSPPQNATVGSVRFRIVIFSRNESRVHHTTSHYRTFNYYGARRH